MATRAPEIPVDELLEHAEWLRRLARSLVGDAAEAGDLAQDALEVALTRPPREPGPIRPWLAGVLKNLARLRYRRDERRGRREAAAEVPAEVPTPEALVERVQTQQLLTRHVLELDEPLRSTLLLRYYEGLSAAEIARRQDVPAGTVRWRLKTALDQLRAQLDRSTDGGRGRWRALLAPLALPVPTASAALTAAGGVLIMKAVKSVVVVVLVLVAGVFGSRQLGLWGKQQASASAPAAATAPTGKKPIEPAAPRAPRAPAGIGDADSLAELHDDDPKGPLRLEGQVIDAAQAPVGGALVAIDSNPPRVVKSEQDGSFVFDGLIGRDYLVEAHADAGYAGPAMLHLQKDSEPVILRLAPAGTVEVEVREQGTNTPVAGASVELRSTLTWNGQTGADGKAQLTGVGVGTGLLQLHVQAPGFAPAAIHLSTTGEPSRPQRQLVLLRRGAAVAGRVLDDAGRPVAGARVLALATSEPFPVLDARKDGAVTDAAGKFRFEALAGGTYRFTASHADYAPAATAPIVLDGTREREIEIRASSGATLTGKVQSKAGAPVVSADVRVVARGGVEWRYARHAYTGADGRFKLTGLPRRAVDVVARGDAGSSQIQSVDLAAKPSGELTLVLDVEGALEGMVVEPAGEPVAEAQVLVEPEWNGSPNERQAWAVRRIPVTLADAGGRFRFAGLPAGKYRVRAARPGAPPDVAWLSSGVSASAGDREVKVVLAGDGAVIGKVLLPDGTAPELYSVAVGPARPVFFAAKDGAFRLTAPGGVQNIVIAGPSFEEKVVAEVTIPSGAEEKDLGTITVKKGRSISGRVLDREGAPVAGAKVAAGSMITGGGNELYIEDESPGARTTETDADGRFMMTGFSPASQVIVAGKDGVGRSASLRIPRGEDSAQLDLVLEATGSLAGTLTKDGAPLGDSVIICNPMTATGSNFFTVTGPDGSFALDTLAPGEYFVSAIVAGAGGGRPKDMVVRVVTVSVGARAKVELAAVTGNVKVELEIVDSTGQPVKVAQMLIASGTIAAPTMELLRDGGWLEKRPSGSIPLYMRTAMGGATTVEGLAPGPYTACAIAFPIDPNDPQMQKARESAESLPMTCVPFSVSGAAAGDAPMKVKVVVPVELVTPKP